MEYFEDEAIRKEFAPFLRRLTCSCDDDPHLQRQMRVSLSNFQEALLDAYPNDCSIPIRSYLTRNLARFACALAEALRPESRKGEEIFTYHDPGAFSGTWQPNSDWLGDPPDLNDHDWLNTMEQWPNCVRLPEAVTRLKDPLRTVFTLSYFEGRSLSTIALRLNLSEHSVHSLLSDALACLRGDLVQRPLALK